ncbi:MAG TPA: aldehyde dehydrogenase family protein, partial [Chryseosolibacter sp.]|nr:aldehyde dehydrogenase family protein [Chryseosolibacter sp.]
MFKSINPFDQRVLREYPGDDAPAIADKISRAAASYRSWKREPFGRRAERLHRAGQLLRSDKDRLALLIAQEMGKVVAEASAEVEKCANACDFYAQHGEQFLKDQPVSTEAAKSIITYQPIGPVLAIMPWNFPFWQVFRFAVPALMAGNTGLLKHAANVCGCSLAIENIFREADFPEGVFQSLLVDSGNVEKVIDHPDIAAVTLTGSEQAGMQVASSAGRNLKKTVLELGGSDPFIVLEDADLDLA